jgi:hypothetical protein
MNENKIAEACLCNSGIASGNLALNTQKSMIDQFYRTATLGGGGFGARAGPMAMTSSMLKTNQRGERFHPPGRSYEGSEEEESEEEEEEEEKIDY